MSRNAVIPLVALLLLCLAGYHVGRNSQAEPPLNPPVAPARVPFGSTIAGSGVIEPWTENIALGTHLAGVVEEVCVRVGEHVEEGAPLFRLDERHLRAELAVREAMLVSAQAQLEKLNQQPRPEELPGSLARVRETQARFDDEEERFQRSVKLMERRIISEEDFSTRRQNLAVAREQLAKAQADDKLLRAGAWEPDKAVARAAVIQAQAQVDQTRTELERLTVRAAVSGQILQVKVRPGEYVAQPANTELMVLGNIAPLHVRVDIDEADIPRFRHGMPARGFVRGETEHAVDLEFVRVDPYVVPKKSLTGSNSERIDTRVLHVLYSVTPNDRALYVGQQLDVFIDITDATAGPTDGPIPPVAVK